MKNLLIMFCIVSVLQLSATIINIPANQPTIQEGINVSVDGDTVLVQPGAYVENINFNGRSITLGSLYLTTQDTSYISNTIIDGNQNGSVVIFENGESLNSILNGFKLTNGTSTYDDPDSNSVYYNYGGGIYCKNSNPNLLNLIICDNMLNATDGTYCGGGIACYNSSPSITKVIVKNNKAYWGAGIHCSFYSSPNIIDVKILGNICISVGAGGGLYCIDNSNPILSNVLICNNTSGYSGGGIYCNYASPIFINITVTDNIAFQEGGGICCRPSSNPIVVNGIFWNNYPQEILVNASASLTITYSDILGGYNGVGNIDSDPLFLDPLNRDFHLSWANFPIPDSTKSPCIDTGDPDIQYNDPDGTIADIGAFYFHQELIAYFVADVISGLAPMEVQFTDLSSGNIVGWMWDFENDGTIDSYEQNPLHTYLDVGIYTVSLTVSDGTNEDTEIKVDYITVGEPIITDFEAVPLIGLAPLNVQFTDLSTGGLQELVRETKESNNSKIIVNDNSRDIVSWEWDFDNNGSIDSYEQNPQWTYTEAGLYTVTLTVSDGSNTGTETKVDYITVGEPIIVDFEADITLGSFPLDVQFTDLSSGGLDTSNREIERANNTEVVETNNSRDIVIWEWDFDNDGVIDSNEQNPAYIYNSIGYYSVCLTVYDNINNSNTLTKEDYIFVNPDIDFSYQSEGIIESGISLLSEDVLYCAASGDCVYRFNNSGQIEYTLNVNGDVKSATTITPDHNVYIASTDYNLYSFNSNGVSNTGWPLSLGSEATASVASDSLGNIYIGTQNGIFQAVDPFGENIWSYNVGAPVHSSAVISSENTLYVVNTDGRLYAFDLNTIIPNNVDYKWRIETNAAVSATPALDDLNNIYITNEDGQLLKINDDGTTGNVMWTYESGTAIVDSSPILDSEYNIYFGCTDGRVYSVNNNGQLNWMSDEFGMIRSTGALAEFDDIQSRIYIGSDDCKLYALSIDDGSILWHYTAESAIVCPILYENGKIYFGTVNGEILVINDPNISTGTIFRNTSIWSTFQGNNLRTGNQAYNMTSVGKKIINVQSHLLQNYPNPFNPTTIIEFSILIESNVELSIYNLKGQKIESLVNTELDAGNHTVIWNGSDSSGKKVSSGIYFYKMIVNGKTKSVKKCLLLK